MTDPLDDRLRALGDGPEVPLAPAAAVRGRGAQRRARQRALLGGGAAAVLVLATAGGYALATADRGPVVLRQAAPTASASPSPSTPAPVSPSPLPEQGGPVDPDRLLDAADVGAVVGGSWSLEGDRADRYSTYAGCPGREVPAAEAGVVRTLRAGDGSSVGQTLLRYADDATAARELAAFDADLQACPERPVDSADGTERYERLALPGDDADRSYARRTYTPDGDVDPVVTTFSVSTVGPWLSFVAARAGDLQDLTDLADARIAGQERAPVVPPPAPSPTREAPPERTPAPAPTSASPSPSDPPASQLLLTVREADRAEPGAWRREGQDVEGPVLDPCGTGRYPRGEEFVDSATVELVSPREAGGTSVVQTVVRYTGAAVARDALAEYERSVRRCPQTTSEESGTTFTRTHEVADERAADGLREVLVRSTNGCAQGCSTGYQYYAAQQTGDVVSVLVVVRGEDGDPGVRLVRRFAEQAASRLTR